MLESLAPYGPALTDLTLAVRKLVREEAPEATELVYDVYYTVALNYSLTGKPGDSFIHITVFPRWVNLGFTWGVRLQDPQRLLQGTGKQIRHIRITRAEDLEAPHIRRFVAAAISNAKHSEKNETAGKTIVRAVAAKRRKR